jgi:predicted metal-dependent HD superfamily phosphohydrolase
MTPFDGIRNAHLEKVAAELYSDEMPYHNFVHVLGTLAAGEKLVDRCLAEGVSINAEVVYYALLFHDAGYHEDHISKGFTSKEEYSAHLAVRCLRAEAIPEDTIERIAAAILSTQRDAKFTSNEEKAVRAADLAGLAGDYKTFRSNAEKLRQEEETLTGVQSQRGRAVAEPFGEYSFVPDHCASCLQTSAEPRGRDGYKECDGNGTAG